MSEVGNALQTLSHGMLATQKTQLDLLEQIRIANLESQKQQEKNAQILGQIVGSSLAQFVPPKIDEKKWKNR